MRQLQAGAVRSVQLVCEAIHTRSVQAEKSILAVEAYHERGKTMKRSSDRILTTHAGALPRPEDLRQMVLAKSGGQPYDAKELAERARSAVAEVVRLQVAVGMDCVNDGEVAKPNFLFYPGERLGGIEERDVATGSMPPVTGISGRDAREFPEYFAVNTGRRQIGGGFAVKRTFCTGPIMYVGQAILGTDLENLKTALAGTSIEEAYVPATAPGSIEHWLGNLYYRDEEAFLYGLADALHEEYQAIVDAGFLVQIDDPGLADSWQMHPDMSLADYRKLAQLRVNALNHGLRGIPEDRVRFHMCWGSYHGPHKHDVPLKDIVDIVLQVHAQAYSLEAANPRHEHEWRVWDDVKLPDGKILIPGVVGHSSDFVEHPELVAERLVRLARLVGRENVIAGTDCGLGGRVGHPIIAWAKLEAMAEGARLATAQLWK